MKKALAVFLTLLMVLACVSCLSVSALDQCEIYGHTYGDEYIIQKPTCTISGVKGKKCEFCNDLIITANFGIDPNNHENVLFVQTNADGTHNVKCLACEQILTQNCRYNNWTNSGALSDSRSCYVCAHVQTVPCDFSACEADNANPGTHICTCVQCGTQKSEACSFTTERTIPANCTSAGYIGLFCKCGNCSVTQVLTALGHVDANEDGKCDRCTTSLAPVVTEPEQPQEPAAQKSIIDKIMEFFDKIIAWIKNLFN